MKKTPSKKITSVLLSLALMLSMVALPSMAMPVQAAEIEAATPTTFVADRMGTTNTIYFGTNNLQSADMAGNPVGTPDDSPIKWRVMAVDTDSNGDTILTLMADTLLGTRRYDPTTNQLWSGSEICNYLNGTGTYAGAGFLQSSFSSEEQRAMAPQYSTVVEQGYNAIDTYTANQTIVIPSIEEMKDSGTWGFANKTERRLNPQDDWWLRTTGFIYNYAEIVNDIGDVVLTGTLVSKIYGVRPAFKINLTSVIFSSSAVGGKPTTVGANLSVATPPTGAQKLTVIDPSTSNLNLVIIPADSAPKTALQGETIAIPYTGAVAGTGKFVSCVIEDSTGEIKYYAKLTNTANGTASIELPTGMPTGSYKIKMFNEQCNADNYTDFASAPIAIDLTVNVSIIPTITGATSHSVTTGYAAPAEMDFTVTGTPAPSFAVTSDGGTGATVTGNRLTIPTGLAANTYTITLTATNFQGSATHTVTFTVSDVISYNITVNAGVGGTATGGGSLAENTTATVVATANNGYKFKQWTEGGTAVAGAGATYSFAVTAHRTLTAEFEPDGSVTATAPTINGTAAGTTNRTVTLGYSDPVEIDFTLGGTPEPTLSVTSDSGAGATVAGNRLTIPTGLAVNTYTIALTADNLCRQPPDYPNRACRKHIYHCPNSRQPHCNKSHTHSDFYR